MNDVSLKKIDVYSSSTPLWLKFFPRAANSEYEVFCLKDSGIPYMMKLTNADVVVSFEEENNE
jgi:hypothetical protein